MTYRRDSNVCRPLDTGICFVREMSEQRENEFFINLFSMKKRYEHRSR